MTKSKLKVPCKCGHSRINHVPNLWEHEGESCAVWACECSNYNPDNLKYLENEYDKRIDNNV
jgi:hypothetical protein